MDSTRIALWCVAGLAVMALADFPLASTQDEDVGRTEPPLRHQYMTLWGLAKSTLAGKYGIPGGPTYSINVYYESYFGVHLPVPLGTDKALGEDKEIVVKKFDLESTTPGAPGPTKCHLLAETHFLGKTTVSSAPRDGELLLTLNVKPAASPTVKLKCTSPDGPESYVDNGDPLDLSWTGPVTTDGIAFRQTVPMGNWNIFQEARIEPTCDGMEIVLDSSDYQGRAELDKFLSQDDGSSPKRSAGDQVLVKTGDSNRWVLMGDGSEVVLGPNTQVEFTKLCDGTHPLKGGLLTGDFGQGLGYVWKKSEPLLRKILGREEPPWTYAKRTPTGVRGTEFVGLVDPTGVQIWVIKGAVAFLDEDGEDLVNITAGFTARWDDGDALPQEPFPFDSHPMADVVPGPPVERAERYLQAAQDDEAPAKGADALAFYLTAVSLVVAVAMFRRRRRLI